MGKQHGSLARAGKVRAMVQATAPNPDKKKAPTGRAKKRSQHADRFGHSPYQMVRSPNAQPVGKRG